MTGAINNRITMILLVADTRRRAALWVAAGVCSCVVSLDAVGSVSEHSVDISRFIMAIVVIMLFIGISRSLHVLSVLLLWLIATSCSPRRCTRAMIPWRAAWSGR